MVQALATDGNIRMQLIVSSDQHVDIFYHAVHWQYASAVDCGFSNNFASYNFSLIIFSNVSQLSRSAQNSE